MENHDKELLNTKVLNLQELGQISQKFQTDVATPDSQFQVTTSGQSENIWPAVHVEL